MEELVFSTFKKNQDNISDLLILSSELCERRLCEISESAHVAARFCAALLREGMDIYEVLSLISDSVDFPSRVIHDGAISENISRIKYCISALNKLCRAAFCEMLLCELSDLGISVSESDFLKSPKDKRETFIYVKNALADEAYDVFSENLSDARVRYARDFKEACLAVSGNEVTYCLLPLEEGGMRLSTIAQLIFNNELKIDDVTPVFGFDGNANMKYALLSKSFSVPDIAPDDDRYLEIRINADIETPLSEILFVAESYFAKAYRINMVYFDTEDGPRNYYSLVLRDEGRDFSAFLTYLTIFVSDFTPIGIYKNLE